MEYFKDFEKWHKLEIELEEIRKNFPLFSEGDIWWTSVGVNLGTEICGKGRNFTRPVLILKKFNRDSFLGVPLTSLQNIEYSIKVRINNNYSFAKVSQIKTYSAKRLQDKMSKLSISEMKIFIDMVIKILSPHLRGSRSFRR
jgi:mRNA interferase MazF